MDAGRRLIQIQDESENQSQQERRSRSQVIEMALEEFLRKRGGAEDEIVTSEGRFEGKFSREETYAR